MCISIRPFFYTAYHHWGNLRAGADPSEITFVSDGVQGEKRQAITSHWPGMHITSFLGGFRSPLRMRFLHVAFV